VRVVAHREPEVFRSAYAGHSEGVFARAEELDHREREVGEEVRRGRAARVQEFVERPRIGLGGERRSHLDGERDDAVPPLRLTQHAT
jgi:hypothetical protein